MQQSNRTQPGQPASTPSAPEVSALARALRISIREEGSSIDREMRDVEEKLERLGRLSEVDSGLRLTCGRVATLLGALRRSLRTAFTDEAVGISSGLQRSRPNE